MEVRALFTDSELLLRTANGDQRAFKMIYDSYAHKIYTHAFRLVKNSLEAEEIMHEVLLKLWQMGSDLKEINNLDAWLKTVSRNRCLNLIRKRLLDANSEKEHTANYEELTNATEEAILLKDTKKVLQAGIQLLSKQQREVYLLCHSEGLKYDEAAEKLNISPDTVHTHMKRALKFLRNYVSTHTEVAIAAILLKLL